MYSIESLTRFEFCIRKLVIPNRIKDPLPIAQIRVFDILQANRRFGTHHSLTQYDSRNPEKRRFE
jgi:hypothetical protein